MVAFVEWTSYLRKDSRYVHGWEGCFSNVDGKKRSHSTEQKECSCVKNEHPMSDKGLWISGVDGFP